MTTPSSNLSSDCTQAGARASGENLRRIELIIRLPVLVNSITTEELKVRKRAWEIYDSEEKGGNKNPDISACISAARSELSKISMDPAFDERRRGADLGFGMMHTTG